MKQIILTILMVVWANGMFAQTECDSIVTENNAETEDVTPSKFTDLSQSDMAQLWKKFQQYASAAAEDEKTPSIIEVPVSGKNKFTRHHHFTQRLEMSFIGGTDGDGEEAGNLNNEYKNQADANDVSKGSNFNFGLNFGYSWVAVPGSISDNTLRLNKFGFAYSLGAVASFDRQNYYGMTCDFLAKMGVEAGYGGKLGIGMDFLIGTGKSAGEYVFPDTDDRDDDEDISLPYTSWCLKYGAQLWIRSNMLHVSMKNTDVRLFARYVFSKNPENENDLLKSNIICNWFEESWSFGMTICYEF